MIGFAIIAAVYALTLLPLAFALFRTLKALSRDARSAEVYEGIAASCLVAVCAALLLTRGIGIHAGILAWLAFVLVCGIAIWLPKPLRLRDVLASAVAPSLTLLAALLAVYLIPFWLFGTLGPVISATLPPTVPVGEERALTFTLFASIASIPAIAVAVYARNRITDTVKALYGVDPKKLSRVEKAANSLVRIGTTVAAFLVVIR